MRKITGTDKIFISLLRAGICGGKADEFKADDETLKEVFERAKSYALAHIVGEALFRHGILKTGETADLFRAAVKYFLQNYQKQCYETGRICELFEKEGIPYILLKGSVIREFYPEPWLRASCDIDILIKEEDLQRAENSFLNVLGYKNAVKGAHDWSFKTVNGVLVELHFTLMEEEGSTALNSHSWSRDCLYRVWQSAIKAEGKEYEYKMSDELFYFYHIAHMAKHFENGGCGIKPFLDLWILRNKLEFDKEKRDALLQKEGLKKFEECVCRLSDVWFADGKADETTAMVEKFIFDGGVGGSKENYVTLQQSKTGGKFSYFIKRVFLPYDFLKFQYPVLQKHKWLLPLLWCVRWFKRIFVSRRLPNMIQEFNYNRDKTRETGDNILKRVGL